MFDPSFFLLYLLPKYHTGLRDFILYFGRFGSKSSASPAAPEISKWPLGKNSLCTQFSVYFSSPPQPLCQVLSFLAVVFLWVMMDPRPRCTSEGLAFPVHSPRNSSSFSPGCAHPCISCLSKWDLKKKIYPDFVVICKENIGLPWSTGAPP